MQENFFRSSVSCLVHADLLAEHVAEGKKSDPCWQVTQQLHHHIEKVPPSLFLKKTSKQGVAK